MEPTSPAVELAAALRRGELSPVELLDACLDQVDKLNPTLNAVIWRNDEQARTEARTLADAIARGRVELPPFAGVPLPVKDLTPVAGWPVTYGSSAAPEGPSDEDELVVAALRRAGFILTGRTNTPEFGTLPAAENARYGISRNPYDPNRTPGGSSGGAASAVAAGMFPLAHANDGGGSIRIPAACCGLVGLKPSRGRVPAKVAAWLGAVSEGVITRTVGDTAAVLDEICGPDPLCWFNAPAPDRPFAAEVGADPGRLRIGLLSQAPLGLPIADAPGQALRRTASLLEDLGHHVSDTDEAIFPVEALGAFLTLAASGLGGYEGLGIDWTETEPHVAASHEATQAVSSLALVHAVGELQLVSRRTVARWGRDYDVLLTPSMTIDPPVAGSILEEAHAHPTDPPADVFAMAAFTAPFNVTGQPAVSLPIFWSESGLPVGVQLIAGPWQEPVLIRLASQLEQAAPWAHRRPPHL